MATAAIDDDGSGILGRSDDTIKIAGKRLGRPKSNRARGAPGGDRSRSDWGSRRLQGQALASFVCSVLVSSDTLGDELKTLVATRLGKPLRPQAVEFVQELPKTRNAKVMRRVIRSAYLDQDAGICRRSKIRTRWMKSEESSTVAQA